MSVSHSGADQSSYRQIKRGIPMGCAGAGQENGALEKVCATAFPCITARFLHQTHSVSMQMYHRLYHRCTKPTSSGSVSCPQYRPQKVNCWRLESHWRPLALPCMSTNGHFLRLIFGQGNRPVFKKWPS